MLTRQKILYLSLFHFSYFLQFSTRWRSTSIRTNGRIYFTRKSSKRYCFFKGHIVFHKNRWISWDFSFNSYVPTLLFHIFFLLFSHIHRLIVLNFAMSSEIREMIILKNKEIVKWSLVSLFLKTNNPNDH